MKTTAQGLVIWETRTGEADRVITILTADGVITAYAKGSLRPKNKLTSPTAMLSLSDFELFTGKNMFTVDDALVKLRFVRLMADATAYALAVYFCELMKLLAPIEDDAREYLSLLLNALYLLDEGKKPRWLIKCVLELRLMALAGYAPQADVCAVCAGAVEDGFFDAENGVLLCADCARRAARPVNCGAAMSAALRHILYAPAKKAFAFDLAAGVRTSFAALCEDYVQRRIERRLPTLDFYVALAQEK
ncbi:MAG: DNA repair protein RecO [Oscillospiraceae bacterium]|nr:DNA repair protein RecO [Oscillospiraceae bacterium]